MEFIMQILRALGVLAAFAGLAQAVPASAHTHVVSSTPAASAAVSNVRSVTITFNEAFMPALSGLEIVMMAMPGTAGHHPEMKITGVKLTPSADRKSLVAALPRPLAAGTYDVNWHAVGADTHRMTGKVSFTVR
jgi:methionine-rich copper-binding protein CopC